MHADGLRETPSEAGRQRGGGMQLSTYQRTAFEFSRPLYAQVAAYLRGQISMAAWTPAAPMPNEAALAKEIGVSIGTVRKALAILEDERLIHRRQGRGTFVVDASERADAAPFSMLTQDGRRLRVELVAYNAAIVPAPAEAAAALNIDAGRRSIAIDLQWRAGPLVRGNERVIVAEELFPGLDKSPPPAMPTLYPIYALDHNIVVYRVDERIKAIAADEPTAAALNVAPGEPVTQVTRLARTRSGEVVEWSRRAMALGEGAHYDITLG